MFRNYLKVALRSLLKKQAFHFYKYYRFGNWYGGGLAHF